MGNKLLLSKKITDYEKIAFCIIALLAVISNKSSAQFMIGPQAGLNVATLTGADFTVNSKPGWDAGVFIGIPLGKHFSVMPAAIYSMRGFKYEYNNTVDSVATDTSNNNIKTTALTTTNVDAILGYLDVPILLTFFTRENKGLLIQVGPQVSFLITDNSKINATTTVTTAVNGTTTETKPGTPTTSVSFKGSDVSIVGGVGYKFETLLMLYARVSTGLGSVQDANFVKSSDAGHSFMFNVGAALCFGSK